MVYNFVIKFKHVSNIYKNTH
uniref:ABC transporter ATP-binding protein n=1 Tax=Heterorhabditis bacteriophora TaxID=37862 RepID=A0A1I7WNQ3_HETBA